MQELRVGPTGMYGALGVPDNPRGVVLFAHGSGSGRHSPRNTYVAAALRDAGIATLLLDLLTREEETDRANVFDIRLLASRLLESTDWIGRQPWNNGLPLGYFGASTGGGAALLASAARPDIVAVVSRGGRPDLAMDALPLVSAPTLLIVGSLDTDVIRLNELARRRLAAESEMIIVAGASHLFEEAGKLDEVITHSRHWFLKHFERVRIGKMP